jgi:enamine deaminase RidA (YjgF/YER057c/UK114 family)
MERTNISSGAQWEDIVGYSRAVRIGNIIEISGTTAVRDGKVQFIGDAYGQTRLALQIIEESLKKTRSSMNDVIRTRIYVTDISRWKDIARAHAEFFHTIKPATSMVEVKALIDKDMLVEIEATAVVDKKR